MITELKKKEILSVKELVDAYKANIDTTKKEIDAIDDKYRKLAEEEKKHLKEVLSDYKSQQKVWEKMFNNYDSTMVKEALGESYETTATIEEEPVLSTSEEVEEEKIVDTVFEENNVEDAPELIEEEAFAEPETTETAETVETVEEAEDSVPVLDVDDGWPEFPEEWK